MQRRAASTLLLASFIVACGGQLDGVEVDKTEQGMTYNGAYSECSQILEHGIFDTYSEQKVDKYRHELAYRLCKSSEYEAYDIVHQMVVDQLATSSSGGGGGSVDVLGLFTVGGGGGSSSSTSKYFSFEEFKKHFVKWKSTYCSQYNEETESDHVYNIFKQSPNAQAVDAWKACVLKYQPGLVCTPETWSGTTTNGVTVLVEYRPGSVNDPMGIDLSWATVLNLTANTNPLPTFVGASLQGNQGQQATFTVVKKSEVSIIDINARAGNLTTSCGVKVPAVKVYPLTPPLVGPHKGLILNPGLIKIIKLNTHLVPLP